MKFRLFSALLLATLASFGSLAHGHVTAWSAGPGYLYVTVDTTTEGSSPWDNFIRITEEEGRIVIRGENGTLVNGMAEDDFAFPTEAISVNLYTGRIYMHNISFAGTSVKSIALHNTGTVQLFDVLAYNTPQTDLFIGSGSFDMVNSGCTGDLMLRTSFYPPPPSANWRMLNVHVGGYVEYDGASGAEHVQLYNCAMERGVYLYTEGGSDRITIDGLYLVDDLKIYTGSGNDSLKIDDCHAVYYYLHGGSGSDTLYEADIAPNNRLLKKHTVSIEWVK